MDVEVQSVDDTVLASFVGVPNAKAEISKDAWLQIAEWVSDPVEKPKVGDWVVDDRIPRLVVNKRTNSPFREVSVEYSESFEKCDPPPLVKALDDLVSRCGDIQTLSAGYFLPTGSGASVKAVINEWRAIKRQMGVE